MKQKKLPIHLNADKQYTNTLNIDRIYYALIKHNIRLGIEKNLKTGYTIHALCLDTGNKIEYYATIRELILNYFVVKLIKDELQSV